MQSRCEPIFQDSMNGAATTGASVICGQCFWLCAWPCRSSWTRCNWKRQPSLIRLRCPVWAISASLAESDFAGKADYGVCSSKAMKYFGFKLHSIVSLSGVIMSFLLTPANRYDNQPVVELLDYFSHQIHRLLGDGTYNDPTLPTLLQQYRSVEMFAP